MSENNNEEIQEEIVNEDVIDTVSETSEVDELKARITQLELDNKQLDNKFHMAYADAQNISKRAKIDADNLVNNKVAALVENILPALDSFERALKTDSSDQGVTNFLKGFEMIYDQLYQALVNVGVERIDCLNKEFDANLHQAIMQVNDENFASNIVVEEVQKGYTFRNKIIRPAMVKVNE